MTLLKAGYWHTTYWAENYWQQDYWLEYGTAVVGGDSARYYYMQGPKKEFENRKDLFLSIKKLLEALKGV